MTKGTGDEDRVRRQGKVLYLLPEGDKEPSPSPFRKLSPCRALSREIVHFYVTVLCVLLVLCILELKELDLCLLE